MVRYSYILHTLYLLVLVFKAVASQQPTNNYFYIGKKKQIDPITITYIYLQYIFCCIMYFVYTLTFKVYIGNTYKSLYQNSTSSTAGSTRFYKTLHSGWWNMYYRRRRVITRKNLLVK